MARKAGSGSKKSASGGGVELEIELPAAVADEIEAVARRTRSSTGFIVRRALAVGGNGAAEALAGPLRVLGITVLEDDPDDLVAKIRAAGDEAQRTTRVTAAWAASRERFLKWAEREEQNHRAQSASSDDDDLDRQLADARTASTTVERLTVLARSEYPRVRALVAEHAATPTTLIEKLAADREPVVRTAAAARVGK